MKVQRRNPDRISTLPQDIIGKILSLMPIRDALRTSILSKKWRCRWKTMPKVAIDDDLFALFSSDNEEIYKLKVVNAIFHILLLHKGPILEFVFSVSSARIFNEFDQIIVHLSKNNNIKRFIYEISLFCRRRYKLPSSFFSLHGLEHLVLTYCVFEPPSIFNGFSILRNLRLYNVDITAKTLLRFLTNCPLLEEFILTGYHADFTVGDKDQCTFAELFKCLPSVQVLEISGFYIKQFTAGGMPQKLPTYLVHLRILAVNVCFRELSYALFVSNSSPNLVKLRVEICTDCAQQAYKPLLDFDDCLGVNLDHLKELEITECSISPPEMAFVKLIMGKTPLLKKARIELCTSVSVDQEVQMFRDLLLLPFPRASPAAKFIIERPKS